MFVSASLFQNGSDRIRHLKFRKISLQERCVRKGLHLCDVTLDRSHVVDIDASVGVRIAELHAVAQFIRKLLLEHVMIHVGIIEATDSHILKIKRIRLNKDYAFGDRHIFQIRAIGKSIIGDRQKRIRQNDRLRTRTVERIGLKQHTVGYEIKICQ